MKRLTTMIAAVFVLGACVSYAHSPGELASPSVPTLAQDISLNLIGSGGEIWALCPGCAPPENPPALRPLRNQTRGGNVLWALDQEYIYVYEPTCEAVVVPEGFVTDLASIPAWARIRHNPANYAEAALIHDWLYAIGARGQRGKADRVFRTALEETGHRDMAGELYWAVDHGGAAGYGLPGDFSFWDSARHVLVQRSNKPASGFVALDQLVEGGSDLVAGRFGEASHEAVSAHLRDLCEQRRRHRG